MPTEAATAPVHKGLDLWQVLIHANFVSQLVFAVLVFCSVISLAVIIERWIVLRNARKSIESDIEQLDQWGQAQQWDQQPSSTS